MNICTFKDKIQIFTAIISLLFGFSLTLAGFIISPAGEIHDSVLWVLGQCFIYAGSIFGIHTYYSGKLDEFEFKINKQLKDNENTSEENI